MFRTIKSSTEVSRLFSQGTRLHTPYLTLIVAENVQQHDRQGRVAFIAGKKLGNAVWRNAAKRRMREACRFAGGPWPGYDVIFLAKRNTAQAPIPRMVASCNEALRQRKIARSEENLAD